MKISVLGRGAVGGVLGGLLSLSGHSVYFVPREKGQREAGSRARPLRLILPDGWRLASPAVKPEAPELLLVALGRHHLRLMKKDSFRLFGGCPAVFANCDPTEPERLGFERGRVSYLLTLMDAVSLQQGEAELASARSILVMQKGSPFAALSGDLSVFGVEARFVEDVVPYMNSFFVFQLLYLPTALCNTTLGHFLSFPEGRDLARRLLSEGLRMQERTGRRMARLPVMDPKELLDRLGSSRSFDSERCRPGRAYSPVLQDMLANKPSEAREITKRAVEAAATAGLELPWNWKLYQKAGRVLSLGWYRSPAELAASLA